MAEMTMTSREQNEPQRRRPRSRIYGGEPEGAVVQRGVHGEGAATIGNSVRGALSGGLSGATTTRGGQQGGIGASAYDVEPGAAGESDRIGETLEREQDLTLGEQFGGTVEDPQPS
jgi:hypothetical protein